MNGRGYTGDRRAKRDTLGEHDRSDHLTKVSLVLALKKIHGREGVGKREGERKEDPLQGELGAALFHRE